MQERPLRFLIVKTSALGDIIQSLGLLSVLHKRFPHLHIAWAVEEQFAPIVAAHPLVHCVLSFDIRGLKSEWKEKRRWQTLWKGIAMLRTVHYDVVFDLQGNCKSGVITRLARGKVKVGLGRKSVREWPNLLATQRRFELPRGGNIRLQLLSVLEQFFEEPLLLEAEGILLSLSAEEREPLTRLLRHPLFRSPMKVMVCPGSQWVNKQLSLTTLIDFLQQMHQQMGASFFLVWGDARDRELVQTIHSHFPNESCVVEKLSLPTWQNLMNAMDLVVAVDSSALHLSATTCTRSFSMFGPTSPDVFKPLGPRHFAVQGPCPYGEKFSKVCPFLRSCPTGACMKNWSGGDLFRLFAAWYQQFSSTYFRCN